MNRLRLVTAILGMGLMIQDGSTQILQVVIEPIKPGMEGAYASVEAETAAACASLKCPHPHLALQPVDGPLEIWWLNLFGSEAERLRVVGDYSGNAPLMDVLRRNNSRKSAFTGALTNTLFRYNAQSSDKPPDFVGARFVVVVEQAVSSTEVTEGAVFDGPEGRRLVLRPARTRDEADRHRARGSGAAILAIRPEFGMPASTWIDADPEFWARNPAARR